MLCHLSTLNMSGILYHIAIRYFEQIWKSCRSSFNLNIKGYTTFVLIYHYFLLPIMSTKSYLYLIYRKKLRSTRKPTRHRNTCKSHFYLKFPYQSCLRKSNDKEYDLSEHWENEGDLVGEEITTITANSTSKTLTENMPWKKLFASEFLLALREEWFSSHEFFTGTSISKKKYRQLRSKHKSSFYSFND